MVFEFRPLGSEAKIEVALPQSRRSAARYCTDFGAHFLLPVTPAAAAYVPVGFFGVGLPLPPQCYVCSRVSLVLPPQRGALLD